MSLFQTSEYGKKNKKVIFLLAGWKNQLWMFWPFAKILEINGYYCITYAYQADVFSPDTAKTVKDLTAIAQEVLTRMQSLRQQGYNEFFVFGTSLGTVIALLVANKSKNISKIILNTAGSDVAQAVWSWDNVNRSFKQSLINQQFTLEKLQKAWSVIQPKNNIDNLMGKKILAYVAKNDELIPYSLGIELIQKLQTRGYYVKTIVNTHLRHFSTGLHNLFNARIYLDFLKK